MADKASIQKRFSADPDRYYKVKLFEEQGFTRTACAECGRFFWALDGRKKCPDHSDDIYSFIGDPPTSKRFDYSEAWVQIADFFKKNGHAQIGRYPVVCRWRDDLYFTIASIVDFQRKAGSKITFEFPSNPLVVPHSISHVTQGVFGGMRQNTETILKVCNKTIYMQMCVYIA